MAERGTSDRAPQELAQGNAGRHLMRLTPGEPRRFEGAEVGTNRGRAWLRHEAAGESGGEMAPET